MGAADSKNATKDDTLYDMFGNFLKQLDVSKKPRFKEILINSSSLREEWSSRTSEQHLSYLIKHLFGNDKATKLSHILDIYGVLAEGPYSEKAQLICSLCSNGIHLKIEDLTKYVRSIISSAFIILKKSHDYKLWCDISYEFDKSTALASYLLQDINHDDNGQIPKANLEQWLGNCGIFGEISKFVYKSLFLLDQVPMRVKLPEPKTPAGAKSVLTFDEVLLLSLSIEKSLQTNWRLLFNTASCGQSWATLCKYITGQGPTFILIETENHTIGGFASTSWNYCPHFFGNDDCFLFTLRPEIKIFDSSNYNKNFQYFNTNQATLPNGLAMGGQFEYWGIFIDSDFGKVRISKSCSTFKNYLMSVEINEAKIKHLEVWGVGKPDLTPEDMGERTGLSMDKDPTATAMLEVAGKTFYSKDIRDMKPVDEEGPN